MVRLGEGILTAKRLPCAAIKQTMLIAFHKPFGVLSQFTAGNSSLRTLAEFGLPPRVYPLGRLDAESEGLLLLSEERGLNARLLHPQQGHWRLYWAQVEGRPNADAIEKLSSGILIQSGKTLPGRCSILEPPPAVAPRQPPIRSRESIPTCWLAIQLVEGKYHQVRRMTAAAGHPTLRLIRAQIGRFELGHLRAGEWKVLTRRERDLVLLGK